ncbi:hypothetical protein E2562_024566, partial [Oryza meyeriana var. granulata]
TCGKAKDFFGIIQRIYTTFANSTKKWQILKDNITGLTLKSVSTTRWESRIDSVKAIRFQCAEIREALLQVSDIDNDVAKSSEAKGLTSFFSFVQGLGFPQTALARARHSNQGLDDTWQRRACASDRRMLG